MVIAGTRQRLIVGLVALSVALLAFWALTAPSAAAAGSDGVLGEPPVVDRAGGSGDDLHVSDESLTVAFVIPGIFVAATALTVGLALAKRRREQDDEPSEE